MTRLEFEQILDNSTKFAIEQSETALSELLHPSEKTLDIKQVISKLFVTNQVFTEAYVSAVLSSILHFDE